MPIYSFAYKIFKEKSAQKPPHKLKKNWIKRMAEVFDVDDVDDAVIMALTIKKFVQSKQNKKIIIEAAQNIIL